MHEEEKISQECLRLNLTSHPLFHCCVEVSPQNVPRFSQNFPLLSDNKKRISQTKEQSCTSAFKVQKSWFNINHRGSDSPENGTAFASAKQNQPQRSQTRLIFKAPTNRDVRLKLCCQLNGSSLPWPSLPEFKWSFVHAFRGKTTHLCELLPGLKESCCFWLAVGVKCLPAGSWWISTNRDKSGVNLESALMDVLILWEEVESRVQLTVERWTGDSRCEVMAPNAPLPLHMSNWASKENDINSLPLLVHKQHERKFQKNYSETKHGVATSSSKPSPIPRASI